MTVASAFITTLQSPDPEQAPLHPSKRQPWSGVAESVTLVPSSNAAEQDDPQSIPAGDDRIVPEPFRAMVNACWFGPVGTSANAGSSSRSRSTVNWQAPLPLQLPFQAENIHPPSGEAVAVTLVPFATGTTHLFLHCWPVESCTAPWPVTWTVTCWVPGPTLPLPSPPGPHAAVRNAIAATPINRFAIPRSFAASTRGGRDWTTSVNTTKPALMRPNFAPGKVTVRKMRVLRVPSAAATS